jgi:hypothetical protein
MASSAFAQARTIEPQPDKNHSKQIAHACDHPQLLFEGYPILETQQNSSRSRLFLDSRLFKGRARMATWTSRQSCNSPGTSAGGRHFYAAPSLHVGPVFEGLIVSHVQKQYRRQLARSDPSVTKHFLAFGLSDKRFGVINEADSRGVSEQIGTNPKTKVKMEKHGS